MTGSVTADCASLATVCLNNILQVVFAPDKSAATWNAKAEHPALLHFAHSYTTVIATVGLFLATVLLTLLSNADAWEASCSVCSRDSVTLKDSTGLIHNATLPAIEKP